MALPYTHVYFAMYMADEMGIDDVSAYLWGTLYPDTRRLTGLERSTTHGNKQAATLENIIGLSSFQKGVALHRYYDVHSSYIVNTLLSSDVLRDPDPTNRWRYHAAAKLLEDQAICERSAEKREEFLSDILIGELPNQEDTEKAQSFLDSAQQLYREGAVDQAYAEHYSRIGHEQETINRIFAQRDAFSTNERTTILGRFDLVAKKAHDNNPLNAFI